MSDLKHRIDELAELMDEFKLSEAELATDDFRIAFKRRSTVVNVAAPIATSQQADTAFLDEVEESAPTPAAEAELKGLPVTSPMTGIFYSAPNPSSPMFVKEGDEVIAGQTIGLIEAMKVFNEVPCPTSGTVVRIVAESGQLVNLGDPLLYIS